MRESTSRELKEWLDPRGDRDGARLAKALIAIYNSDGGEVILGVKDDGTVKGTPPDASAAVNADTIQAVVRKYSSFAFVVDVEPKEDYITLRVPGGVKTPAVCKTNFPGETRAGAVYIRCVGTGAPSSCEPQSPDDWERTISRWFDNREADIARFVRRHIQEITRIHQAGSLGEWMEKQWQDLQRTAKKPRKYGVVIIGAEWDSEKTGYEVERAAENSAYRGSVREIVAFTPVRQINPNGAAFRHQNAGEVSIYEDELVLDFLRFEKGRALAIRSYEEDWMPVRYRGMTSMRGEPGRWIDIEVVVYRVAEAVRHVLEIGRELACDKCSLTIRWTGLKGRKLTCNPSFTVFGSPTEAEDDEAVAGIEVKTDCTRAELPRITAICCRPLWEKFRLHGGLKEESVRRILKEGP